ncbi:MFS transporter [Nakamurella sp.]|uniref:MFS transporter n=1 Tax=Nakamurella sp. TaxID=1869182 RepID=UPI003B3A577F
MTEPPENPAAPDDAVATNRVAGPGAYRRLLVASGAANLADGLQVIAVPWLASVLTRDPVQIALVTAATRLPWLLFSLPVGAITDRFDRRTLVAAADTARTGLLLLFAVLLALSGADESGAPAHAGLLLIALYGLALLVGLAEVVGDNSAQTLLPSIVPRARLETANGRLWAVETVTNQFVGPPLAGLLIAAGLALPFVAGAGAYAIAAAVVFTIAGDFRPPAPQGQPAGPRAGLRREIGEGFRWLWRHRLLRSLAIALGVLNASSALATAVFVLFGQEVAGLDAAAFGLLLTGSAIGAVIGSFVAPWLTRRVRSGTALALSVVVLAVTDGSIGLMSSFWPLWSLSLVAGVAVVVWNVITVTLRQSLIPDRLLGRVNSVYRFFGWGTVAIGTLLGGLLVAGLEPAIGREWALRLPFLVSGVIQLGLLLWAWPRIGNGPIAAARAAVH